MVERSSAPQEPACPACNTGLPDNYASRYCPHCARDMLFVAIQPRAQEPDTCPKCGGSGWIKFHPGGLGSGDTHTICDCGVKGERTGAQEPVADKDALRRENAELKHDLERQMTIANIECNEATSLKGHIEEQVRDAYLRGWREAVETVIEDYPDAEAPHKDAMGEGCGVFLSERIANRLQAKAPETGEG